MSSHHDTAGAPPGPWAARLKDAGLRVTQARLRTLMALESLDAPQSHDALATTLAEDGLDRITVYRNLIVLCRAQLVRRSHGGDRIWRYSLTVQGVQHRHAHPHFDCRGCGNSRCLSPIDVSLHGQAEALAGLEGIEVVLRGRCAGCAEQTLPPQHLD